MTLPAFNSKSRSSRLVTLGDLGIETRDTIILDSGNADSDGSHTPTYEFRSGNAVVLRTSTGRYVEANDSNGDRCEPASVTGTVSDASSNAGFGKTFKWKYKGGVEQTVTMGSTTASHDTNAEIVALLNADADFSADLIADESGNYVRIRTKRGGSDEYFKITDGTINAVLGFTDNTEHQGTDADYRITLELGVLQNEAGTAVHDEVQAADCGHFDESILINLTKEAKAVLLKKGSKFE